MLLLEAIERGELVAPPLEIARLQAAVESYPETSADDRSDADREHSGIRGGGTPPPASFLRSGSGGDGRHISACVDFGTGTLWPRT